MYTYRNWTESATENIDGEERHVIVVKSLPWRGPKTKRLMKKLDSKANKRKTKQSTIQTLPRVQGENSERVKPSSFPEDFWGFTAQ